jgi:hypothetical protein
MSTSQPADHESQINIFGDREAPVAWVRLVELFKPKRVKVVPPQQPLSGQRPLPGLEAEMEPDLEAPDSM